MFLHDEWHTVITKSEPDLYMSVWGHNGVLTDWVAEQRYDLTAFIDMYLLCCSSALMDVDSGLEGLLRELVMGMLAGDSSWRLPLLMVVFFF